MPPHRTRKLQVREAHLIETACRLIDEVGYTHLTMDMLSEAAGVAKATLYQHFRSKEDVVIASTVRALNNLEHYMDTNTGSAVEQLRSIMRYMMLSGYSADGFPSVIMHDEVLQLFASHEGVRAKFEPLNARLFSLLDHAKADGQIAQDLPNALIITVMMNTMQIGQARRIYPDHSQSTWVEQTLRVFFNGIKP